MIAERDSLSPGALNMSGVLTTDSRLDFLSTSSPTYSLRKERDRSNGKLMSTSIISTSEADLLSLEPKEMFSASMVELDLFSSYAESFVSSPGSKDLQKSLRKGVSRGGSRPSSRPQSRPLSARESLHQPRQLTPLKRVNTASTQQLSSLSQPPSLHSVVLPTEASLEILGKSSHRGKLTSATLTSLKRRSGRHSSASSLHFEDSLHSVSVVQVGIEGERQRLPIFRPLPGKRLTSDPRGDDRHLPSTAFYHYSLNQSQDLPPLSSTSSVSSFPADVTRTTDEAEEGREERLGSASLPNLSINTDLPDPVTDQQSTQSPPDRPVLGGHLLEGNVLEPSHITPSKYMTASSPHAHQLTSTRQSFQTTNMSLYQNAANTSSAGSVASAQGGLEPLPYQVHSRVLGWKLTSVQRRKELIDVLDMMKERARQGHSLANTSSKSTHSFNRRVLHTLAPPDSYLNMSEEGGGQGHERGTGPKLSVREVGAWQSYVSRTLRSRQSYRSATQIKNIMEERRKTEKLTQISSQRHELLRNRKHVKRQNILQDKSTDDVAQLQSHAIYRQIGGDLGIALAHSTTVLSPPSSPSAVAATTQRHYLKPLVTGERDTSSQLLRGGKGSPTEFLYNFPVSIHKQRDRMDILESVALRQRLEGRLNQEREWEKEVLIEQLIQQGVGLNDHSPSNSPTHRENSWDEELALLGIDGLGLGEAQGFSLGEGSDFAYLDELRGGEGGGGGFDDGDYDPDQVDSIIERFGGGSGSRSEEVE